MNFENRPTHSLRPYPGNARTHSPKQIKQIARSIERFGFNNPVLVDDDDQIIAGHGRVEAAKLRLCRLSGCPISVRPRRRPISLRTTVLQKRPVGITRFSRSSFKLDRMPFEHVRYRRNSGKHLLLASISQFDPDRTSPRLCLGQLRPISRSFSDGKVIG
jgi:hypothetical protein